MKNFNLDKSLEMLSRTPDVLQALLLNLSEDWTAQNEGQDTWTPHEVVGHLVHLERTDWLVRVDIIVSEGGDRRFAPVNRTAQISENAGKSLEYLITEFKQLRSQNIARLKSRNLQEEDMSRTGIHPEFGEVTLAQLLATWTVHDLTHTTQIIRVMAKHYKEDVGPWIKFLSVLKS
jgi:hypothetical protein